MTIDHGMARRPPSRSTCGRRRSSLVLLVTTALLSACSEDSTQPAIPQFASAELSQGRATWMQVCRNCHLMGVAGAPAIADAGAWQQRLAGNRERLYASAINGIGTPGAWTMPPRGGNAALSDADVQRAVDFMIAAVEALDTE